MISEEKIVKLSKWICDNAGYRFSLYPLANKCLYLDYKGLKKSVKVVKSTDPELLKSYLIEYANRHNGLKSLFPQVEFSEDMRTFKIFNIGENFSDEYQETRLLKV